MYIYIKCGSYLIGFRPIIDFHILFLRLFLEDNSKPLTVYDIAQENSKTNVYRIFSLVLYYLTIWQPMHVRNLCFRPICNIIVFSSAHYFYIKKLRRWVWAGGEGLVFTKKRMKEVRLKVPVKVFRIGLVEVFRLVLYKIKDKFCETNFKLWGTDGWYLTLDLF